MSEISADPNKLLKDVEKLTAPLTEVIMALNSALSHTRNLANVAAKTTTYWEELATDLHCGLLKLIASADSFAYKVEEDREYAEEQDRKRASVKAFEHQLARALAE